MKRRTAAFVSMLLAMGLLLVACSDPDRTPEVHEPVILEVGATLEPTGLDPSTVAGAGTPFVFLYNVYETLVKIDAENNLRPLLATDWSVSGNGLVHTFHLDSDATFASGDKVTADAVVTSFERAMNDDDITELVRTSMDPVEKVEAEGDNTVVVTLDRVSQRWLYDMAGPAGIIYDPEGLDNLDEAPAGSGPFVFEDWDVGASITLATDTTYWGTGPRVDEIVFKYYADPNAMNTAMLSGQLDVISNLTIPESIDEFLDAGEFRVLEGQTHGEVVLGFNHTNEALAKLEVRQAINHAIDREELLETTWGGKGELIGSMVPPLDPWFDESLVDHYEYDPELARELLEKAGYKDGLSLKLRIPTLPYGMNAARFISAQLEEVGIDVETEELEFGAWLEQVFTNHDFDMTIVAHVEPRDLATFADPDYYWLYDNEEFQKMVSKADTALTSEQNVELLRQASAVLTRDAAADWLFVLPNIVITTNEVSGLNANASSLSFDLTSVATNR